MAPHRRIAAEHGSEDKECGPGRRPCSPPSPPPPASAPSPAAVVATAAFTPPLPLRFPATPIQIDDKNHKLTTVVIIVASALAACFLLLTYFSVLRYRSSRRRRRRRSQAAAAAGLPQPAPDADDDELRADLLMGAGGEEPYHVWYIRTVGLDEPMIGAISVCSYVRGEGLVEGTDCAVCLGEFAEGELLRLLPKCSHAFHIPCIDTWLRSHVNCPLCRAPILAPPRPSPSPPFVADGSATAYASATAAADQSDVVAAVAVDSLGAVEEGSEEDGDSAVLPPSHVAVDHPSPGSSFSSEESEIWVTIDLGNGGLGDGAASGTPPVERNGGAELQPVPRSVSMDSSALGGLLLRMRLAGSSTDGRKKPSAGEDASTTKLGTEEGKCKGLSLAEGPHEMERCMSGGRFFLSRFSGRPRSAILPL